MMGYEGPTVEELRERTIAEIEREIGHLDLEKRIVLTNALDRFADSLSSRRDDRW